MRLLRTTLVFFFFTLAAGTVGTALGAALFGSLGLGTALLLALFGALALLRIATLTLLRQGIACDQNQRHAACGSQHQCFEFHHNALLQMGCAEG